MESRNRDEAKSRILRNKSGSALTLITNSDYGIHPFHRFIQENFIDFKKMEQVSRKLSLFTSNHSLCFNLSVMLQQMKQLMITQNHYFKPVLVNFITKQAFENYAA